MTIANHYIHWRKIPWANVLYVPWDPAVDQTDVDTFRQRILAPVLAAVRSRALAPQIDYVVYSSDFPWAVNTRADVNRYLAEVQKQQAEAAKPDTPAGGSQPQGEATEPGRLKWPKHLAPVGSLNGLTYLWRQVAVGDPEYMGLKNNQYMRRAIPEQADAPTLGFRATMRFGKHGQLVESGGQRYLLSMMLAVTAGRGNTVDEVLAYLQRSVEADGTHPPGTIYFVQNRNVRSLVRQRAYPAVVGELGELNVAAEVLVGTMPRDKPDVQGVMMGAAKFDWKRSGSTILPGAICDHLTSFGGVMRADAAQTSLAEFLRFGAAGSSGTVTEPYAIQEKFPFAMIHVHYARGCSLAEAFYQSVYGPYQLLIVGDPLCRPWANMAEVSLPGIEAGQTVSGKLTLRPTAVVPRSTRIERFRIFVDGRLKAECGDGGSVEFDTTEWSDGYHELRAVAIEAGLIASQGNTMVPVVAANHGHTIEASCQPPVVAAHDQTLTLSATSPGAAKIVFLQNARLLAGIEGESGQVELKAAMVGTGPVELRPVALHKQGDQLSAAALGRPLQLVIGRPDDPAADPATN